MLQTYEKPEEVLALDRFREENADLFSPNDRKLCFHLSIILLLLAASTVWVIATPGFALKIILATLNAFLWFILIDVTIHHHHTHHNAAHSPLMKKILSLLYYIVPNAERRRRRYRIVHLNHHAKTFEESDVDHQYGLDHYLRMKKNTGLLFFYFLEMTFIGAYVPGWQDERYFKQVPLENWNSLDYERVMQTGRLNACLLSLAEWSAFAVLLWVLPWFAWGWAYPMLLVKNWAHFFGQFQHYDEALRDPSRSILNRTRSFHFPGWLNYLFAGEISGHFMHHLFPELPYYHLEEARRRFVKDPELSRMFVTYSK